MNNDLIKLMELDEDLALAHQQIGSPPPRKREPGFASLLRIIIDQQVSVASGQAIWKRLIETLGTVTADTVNDADKDTLRAAGLSRPKARYAHCLTKAIIDGDLDLGTFSNLSDNDVMTKLTAITGIGRWTAEIYLMFALGRGDIWPVGDLALAEAAKRLLKLEKRPDFSEMEHIGERWKPYRTTAAVFLWHYYKKYPVKV